MPKVELKVRNLSGFDKSFKNLLTSKVGTITPILCDELIPGSIVDLKTVVNASLPPLASDTYMNCNLKLESFFVPTRLLYAGFWDWMTHNQNYSADSGDFEDVYIPHLRISAERDAAYLTPGSLADYLGVRTLTHNPLDGGTFNIFPFLVYHRVYDDWYRHAQVQTPVFVKPMGESFDLFENPSYLPFGSSGHEVDFKLSDSFVDGVDLGSLRQRNFGFDYFTTALPNAQLGSPSSVNLSLPVEFDYAKGNFTIAALRAANSMQQFAERNQIAGPREQDYIKANYGVDLSSGVAQRAILLGSGEVPVYTKGIYAQSNFDDQTGSNLNPFGTSVGALYGSAVCSGQVQLADNFKVQETGYFIVMASLVPRVTYASGIDRQLFRYQNSNSQSDMANAILENVGMQPIYSAELTGYLDSTPDVFGYVDRYADWKHKNDELHGLLRDGNTLQSFALQRTITGEPRISTDFLQIPTDYMDQVASINSSISNYGYWLDCYHDYKVVQPLSGYAIPSLQDPAYEHGNSVNVEVGGSRL